MGAISFSLDMNLLNDLHESCNFAVLVETGTFKGDTVASARNIVPHVISIERDHPLAEAAKRRFAHDENVQIIEGDAAESLAELQAEIDNQAVLYWLDAHWCATPGEIALLREDSGGRGECQLLQELRNIGSLNEKTVILIDDARLFTAPALPPQTPDQWPKFHEIVEALAGLSDKHNLAIVNDVIAFYPKNLQDKMETYTLHNGVDWLDITNQSREYEMLTAHRLQEKESFETQLEILHAICAERLDLINFLDYEVRSLKAEKMSSAMNDDDAKKPKKGLLRRFKN
jgi:hypothetical protein